MREIKFRAKTLEEGLIYFDLHESQLSGDPDMVFYVRGTPCKVGTEQEYAGHHDKSGREIYEGDIVKVSGFSEPMDVYFKDGYFGWGKEHRGMYSFDPFGTEDLEVIGNIYEHSCLLDKKTENEASLL